MQEHNTSRGALPEEKSGLSCEAQDRGPYWDFSIPPGVPGFVSWEWDISANTVCFSREWLRILQDDDPEIAGPSTSKWWSRMHEDDVIPFLDAARDVVEGRSEVYRTLFRVRRGDGRWAWLLSRGYVTKKDDGQALCVTGALMDISELRSDIKFQHGCAGIDALRDQAMLESAPDLIVRLGEDLFPLFSNPKIVEIMSGKGEPPAGTADIDETSIDPNLLVFLRYNVKRVLIEGRPVRAQMTFATRYGHDVTGEYSFWPEFDGQGKVTAVRTQFRDLTDRILAERHARLNEMRLEALYCLTQMDSAEEEEVLSFVLDRVIELTGSEAGYLFFPEEYPNPEGRMLWSSRHYDFVQEHDLPTDSLHPDLIHRVVDKEGKGIRVMCNGNSLHPLHVGLNGRMRIMRYIAVPAIDSGRVVCIAGVCNKETDYKEADLQQVEAFITSAWHILRRHDFVRELQRAKETAEHANRVKDAFLANVSHELRTPLNGMLSMLQLLSLVPLTDQQHEYVHTANVSGRMLMRIISDILDFSYMSSGKMTLQNESFCLAEALDSPLSMFRGQAERKGLGFHVYFDERIPDVLIGDDGRIRQLVYNVVGNAVKFTEKGEIRVDTLLLPPSTEGQVCIGFRVSDTGIGIPQELQHSVFEAFTQADSSSTRRHSGTGLGLSIVRTLVELMDGYVTLESQPGKGTTVSLTLCLALPDEKSSLPGVSLRKHESTVPEQLDILVAEDDAVSSFAMRSFLQKAGHRVVCVPGGRPALEALLLHPFHCLFTDIQMPSMDGLELVRRIRENRAEDIVPSEETRALVRSSMDDNCDQLLELPRSIITVAVSAHAMTGDKERFLEQGIDLYISKPVIMEELLRVLEYISQRITCEVGASGVESKPVWR